MRLLVRTLLAFGLLIQVLLPASAVATGPMTQPLSSASLKKLKPYTIPSFVQKEPYTPSLERVGEWFAHYEPPSNFGGAVNFWHPRTGRVVREVVARGSVPYQSYWTATIADDTVVVARALRYPQDGFTPEHQSAQLYASSTNGRGKWRLDERPLTKYGYINHKVDLGKASNGHVAWQVDGRVCFIRLTDGTETACPNVDHRELPVFGPDGIALAASTTRGRNMLLGVDGSIRWETTLDQATTPAPVYVYPIAIINGVTITGIDVGGTRWLSIQDAASGAVLDDDMEVGNYKMGNHEHPVALFINYETGILGIRGWKRVYLYDTIQRKRTWQSPDVVTTELDGLCGNTAWVYTGGQTLAIDTRTGQQIKAPATPALCIGEGRAITRNPNSRGPQWKVIRVP